MTQHTPGPWKFEDWDNYTLCIFSPWSDKVRASASGYGDYRGIYIGKIEHQNENECVSKAQAEANARLIAAAPEMLAMLKDIYDFLKRSGYDTRLVKSVIDQAEGRS